VFNPFKKKKEEESDEIVTSIGGASGFGSLRLGPARNVGDVSPDWGLIFVVLSLILFGTVMVYSASIALSDAPKYHVGTEHFLNRHIFSVAVAALVAACVYHIRMNTLNNLAPWLFMLGVLLLIAVLVPGVGRKVNGAARWIPTPLFNLQVTEFMKVAVLLYAVNFTVRKQTYMHSFKKGFAPMLFAVMVVAFLVLMEPDLGALAMIIVIAMGVLVLGGLNLKLFFPFGAGVLIAMAGAIALVPWRLARFLAYLDPWEESNALGKAYQLSHSLIALGRGAATGVGLGDAIEKQHYLPEAHTDFILAIIGEELGFVGVLLLLLFIGWLVWRCFSIGRRAIRLGRVFPGLVAEGVAIWFGAQTFINVGVASGLLPTKGLTLPFISYGGSAMVSCLVAVALVLRVDHENKIIMRGGEV
jgi:cell division protein FtsW